MRIVGAATTSAPSASSSRVRSPACSCARVTAMRRPASGRAARRAGSGGRSPVAARPRGDLYGRAGRHADAAGGFARAYAAGGGAEALWLNAQALFQAGDVRAADEALHLWATQVPDGLARLSEARAELFPQKRGS